MHMNVGTCQRERLPFCFRWNNKNKELWIELKSLVNKLVCQRSFNSKRRVQPHDLQEAKLGNSETTTIRPKEFKQLDSKIKASILPIVHLAVIPLVEQSSNLSSQNKNHSAKYKFT